MRRDRRESESVTDEEISSFLDGSLSKRRRRRIDFLLSRNDELRRTLEEYRRLRELAEREPVPTDPRPAEQYLSQIRERIAAARQPLPLWKIRAWWAGAAAAAILALVVGWQFLGRPGSAPSDAERPSFAVAPLETPPPRGVETTREPLPQVGQMNSPATPTTNPPEAEHESISSDTPPPSPTPQESVSERKAPQFERSAPPAISTTGAPTTQSTNPATRAASTAESPAPGIFRLPYRARLVAGSQMLAEERLALPFRVEFRYLGRRYRVAARREEGDRMAFETSYRADDSDETEGSLERYIDLATTPAPGSEPVRFLVAQPAGQRPRVYMELLPLDSVQNPTQPTNTPKGPEHGDEP